MFHRTHDDDDEIAERFVLNVVDVAVEDADVGVEALYDRCDDRFVRSGSLEAQADEHIVARRRLVRNAHLGDAGGQLHVDNRFDEVLHRLGLGIGKDVDDAACFLDDAAFDDGDAVADFFDNRHFVGNDDDGNAKALVNVLEQLEDGFRRLRVQGRRGFVAQEDVRVAGQGPGDADALLLAARQLGRVVELPVRQSD